MTLAEIIETLGLKVMTGAGRLSRRVSGGFPRQHPPPF